MQRTNGDHLDASPYAILIHEQEEIKTTKSSFNI